MSKPTLRITRQSETRNQTIWLAEWIYPPMSGKWGKSYWVHTYPGSDLITLRTAAKNRAVAQGVATRIMPEIKAALAAMAPA